MSIRDDGKNVGYLATEGGDFVQDENGNYILVRSAGTRVIQSDSRYRVFMTRLLKQNVYDPNLIEITEWVEIGGIKEISSKIDNGDFDIGVFSFGLLELNLINHKGYFSHENEIRSLFAYSRNKTKITIQFVDSFGNLSYEFRGFIQEDYTVENPEEQTVKLSVLSRDAIFRKVFIKGGLVPSGATVRQALRIVLSRAEVTSVLHYDEANINPAMDVLIDDATSYDNKAAIAILDSLMLISGSVLIVDDDDNVIVKDRSHYTSRLPAYAALIVDGGSAYSALDVEGEDLIVRIDEDLADLPYYFYGPGDLLGRQNIHRITALRSGLNRAFNQFVIGDVASFDEKLIAKYGFREKNLGVDSVITNPETQKQITDYYLQQFGVPRRECEITVSTKDAVNVRLLDVCSVSYQKIFKPRQGNPPMKGLLATEEGEYIADENGNYIEIKIAGETGTLPLYRRAVYGSSRYARELSQTVVDPRIGWKVIEKKQNIDTMTTVLKLREIGNAPGEEIYGN